MLNFRSSDIGKLLVSLVSLCIYCFREEIEGTTKVQYEPLSDSLLHLSSFVDELVACSTLFCTFVV